MLQRKNNGSILVMSLITFSIISFICITCSSLILSNNRINELEYKTEKLREENLGAIEIIYSNILKEVKYAVENTKTEDEFYNYLTKNNSKDFINKIKDISESNLNSTTIEMDCDLDLSNKECNHYRILSKSKINNYEKYTLIKVKIKNPWNPIGDEDKKDDQVINVSDLIIFYNYEEK